MTWEDQNYVRNERATKSTGVHLRNFEEGHMKEQREVEENHPAQQPPWLINNIHFYYDGDSSVKNANDKK